MQPTSPMVHHECLLNVSDVASVLRMARAAMGWSQADFAVVAGISARTVKAIEGNRTDPKLSTLKRVAAVLKHHGVELWSDAHGAVGITCAEKERKVVKMSARKTIEEDIAICSERHGNVRFWPNVTVPGLSARLPQLMVKRSTDSRVRPQRTAAQSSALSAR